MKTYVVGFLFDVSMKHVLLIHKRHGPSCVVGRWNGVGGNIEADESPHQAMIREFREETGVSTQVGDWSRFVTLTSDTVIVHFFWTICDQWFCKVRTTTDEELGLYNVDRLPQVVENLKWMIPFLCDPFTVHYLGNVQMARDPVV